jgi:macrolide transport system ATP-binding/permease protein
MTLIAKLRSWSRAMLHRSRTDADMQSEMYFHIESRSADLERYGLPHDEALRLARLEFGGIASQQEDCRQSLGLRFWDDLRSDLRYALRNMRRHAGLTLLALTCLTIAIGSNAAVFSWIEGVLLRPYPLVEHQDRLMAIAGTRNGVAGEAGNNQDLSWPDFQDLQKNCKLIDAFIVDRITGTSLAIGNRARTVTGSLASSNYFDAMDVRPILGRGFRAEEDSGRNGHPVVVISYHLWQDHFHGDQAIIGKTQLLNAVPHTIIGVAPQGFNGTFVGWAMDFWVPLSMQEVFSPPIYKLEDRNARFIEGYVRLKAGVTAAQAQAEVSAVAARLEQAYPAIDRGRGVKLFPLWATPFNNAGNMLPSLTIAMVVVVFMLLIACANVSNLLLVRGFSRRHEMTVKLATGARRGRLIRQLLTEGLVLCGFAGVGGLLIARWCQNLLILLMPARGGVSMNLPGRLDARVLALSLGVCIFSALLFAVVPAIQTSKVDLGGALRAEASGVVGSKRGLLRSSLIAVQVALSFVLLTGAGLLLASVSRMQSIDTGFSLDRVLLSGVDFLQAGYTVQRAHDFQDRLIDALQALPGVESAAFARGIPFSYRGFTSVPVATDGNQLPVEQLPVIDSNEVSPAYLATMGIPVLEGREFTRSDNESAPPVAVVNQVMAQQLWPGQDAIGRRIQVRGRWLQVVGVARNARFSRFAETPTAFFYVPLRQSNTTGPALYVRSTIAPQALTESLVRQIRDSDPDLGIDEVITMREQLERTFAPQQFALLMITVFATLAVGLAMVGLYGVMAYTVSQSRREFGLRMALGASPANLLRLVISHGLVLSAIGVALGFAVAISTSRLLGYLLYHVSPRDPLPFTAAAGIMAITALAASFVPAWRASRTDPLDALRV